MNAWGQIEAGKLLHILTPGYLQRQMPGRFDGCWLIVDVERWGPGSEALTIRVASMQRLREIFPCLKPLAITFSAEPDEVRSMTELIAACNAAQQFVRGIAA